MNTRLKAQLLQYFARKSSQQGFTLADGLALIVILMILMILAALANARLLSSAHKAREVEARNNIGAINRAQQAYHLETGKFADSLDAPGLGIQNPTENYEYSLHTTSNAAFIYGTTRRKRSRSYLGMAIAIPGSDDSISTITLLCQQEEPGIPPSEPILKDGVIGCGENMEDLDYSGDGSGKIEVGKEWGVSELARGGKYDRALELAATISGDGSKGRALENIAPRLSSDAQYNRVLEIAATITDDREKSEALQAIAPHLASDAHYNRALELTSPMPDEWAKVQALKAIAPHLTSETQYDRALEIASTITDDRQKNQALEAIARVKNPQKSTTDE